MRESDTVPLRTERLILRLFLRETPTAPPAGGRTDLEKAGARHGRIPPLLTGKGVL